VVKDEDAKIDGRCGSKKWIAPKVKQKSSVYGPIRADRWSCGRILLHTLDELRKEDRRLKAIAGKLEAHNPE